MNVSHFVKICHVLTILHQLISRGVANFGTWCIIIIIIITVMFRAVLSQLQVLQGHCTYTSVIRKRWTEKVYLKLLPNKASEPHCGVFA